MRLQIDAKVGSRIMEYLWPARRARAAIENGHTEAPKTPKTPQTPHEPRHLYAVSPTRVSLDSARPTPLPRGRSDMNLAGLAPPLRRLGASRSFTDLRSSATDSLHSPFLPSVHSLQRTVSSEALRSNATTPDPTSNQRPKSRAGKQTEKAGDAAEMRTRSSQKSFVLVRISRYVDPLYKRFLLSVKFLSCSLNLLLSIMKEDSFVCRDAHIRTRELEYRNQTWSVSVLLPLYSSACPFTYFSLKNLWINSFPRT